MERIKQQPVYDRADVNQLWSLIILSGSYSKSISFSVFHVKQWKCLNWWQNTRLIPWIVPNFIWQKLETNSKPLKSVK